MKNISLTLKITVAFIVVSMSTLTFIYFVFNNLFQERMLKSEYEKATLIAKTIEPMIGMSYYLGINDEIIKLSEQTLSNQYIDKLQIEINKKTLFTSKAKNNRESLEIKYPIKDPITKDEIGYIYMSYLLDNFNNAFEEIGNKIVQYLLVLGFVFVFFAFVTRYLLNPIGQIATAVNNYQVGTLLDFSSVRTEKETNSIIDAFKKMLLNIREYTILLERYKYAVDESSIVSKTDLKGNIKYINNEFMNVSGFTESELMNQPHKIIRHPDMHQSTFKNLWVTLSEKRVWKGVLKNKKKNGEPYYVKATIVPIFDEDGKTIEYINIAHDITQIVKQQEQIARQTTDILTGLPNRIKLEEDLKACSSPKFALFDLDNFHIIKDYYGYEIGNHTLKETAKMLQDYLKDNNIRMYKLSSGEFGVLVGPSVDIKVFQDICNDILKKIDDYIVHINEDSFNIRATAGISYSNVNTISNASLALRQARDSHKDSLVFEETDNLIKYYENNITWTKKLKSAIAEDRIVVYVQPIVDAKTLQTNKYECLVRMIGEDGSIISPFHFLDIAKKSKLYHTITKVVIKSAIETFAKLDDKIFSINLSVEDLLNKETMEHLKVKMNEYNIASRVVLEIVESEGIDNFDEIIPLINEFKQLGCKISIDDFGTGYSNFAYLMQLNVDYIKIDGSLIKSIDHDVNSQIISQTILDFAKQLELKTVAEFIHNESVMKYTQNMGIDYLQGFHLGEPVPINNLLET